MAVKCILTGQEKVNLSGDTMTGDLKVGSSSIGTNGYIEGTWLKTTKAIESAGDFATINSEGWICKRKPADVLEDIGAQSKIITRMLSLPTASWTGSNPYIQTVTISDVNKKTKVDIQPSEEIYDQLIADNVGYLAIKNVDGTLTALAKGGKPSVDLTVQVAYNNVYYL